MSNFDIYVCIFLFVCVCVCVFVLLYICVLVCLLYVSSHAGWREVLILMFMYIQKSISSLLLNSSLCMILCIDELAILHMYSSLLHYPNVFF